MNIPKDQVLDQLRSRGDDAKADEAAETLPDQIDTEQHADLLGRLGINPEDFLGGLGGQIAGLN